MAAVDLDTPKREGARMTGTRWALLACLILALALRVWGLRFGLPELYYWDEPTVVNRAMRFGTGDLNPHYFYYPALYMYVLFGASGGYFVFGKLLGIHAGATEFAKQYFVDPSGVYVTARLTTALFGTAAVLATYWLGKRFFDRRTGLVAALILAVSPLHVSHSHIAITDVPHALLICLASIACHDVLTKRQTKHYALAGLLIGLGAATKYLAIFNALTLVVAHLLADDRYFRPKLDWSGLLKRAFAAPQLWLGAALTLLGFFVGSPYNILRFGEFMADLKAQVSISTADAQQGFLLLRTIVQDLGWPACVLAALGAGKLLRKPTRATWVFACFPVVYALHMLTLSKSFSRYFLPHSAFVAVLAALGFGVLLDALRPRVGGAAWRPLVAGSAALVLLWPLALSVSWDLLQAQREDTRTTALRWTERNIPRGAAVAVQSLYDRTFDNVPIVTESTISRLERVLPTTGNFGKVRDAVLDTWKARPVYHDVPWSTDPKALAQSGARYVFLTEAYESPSPAMSEWLARSGRQLRRFDAALPGALGWLSNSRETLPLIPPVLVIHEISGAPP
jgi:4-amino-4-deoxy-L-arabinose transferase-like glycosyltransferase